MYVDFQILVGNLNCQEHLLSHVANGLNSLIIYLFIDTSNVETPKLNTGLRLVLAHRFNVSLWTVESHKVIAGAMIN